MCVRACTYARVVDSSSVVRVGSHHRHQPGAAAPATPHPHVGSNPSHPPPVGSNPSPTPPTMLAEWPCRPTSGFIVLGVPTYQQRHSKSSPLGPGKTAVAKAVSDQKNWQAQSWAPAPVTGDGCDRQRVGASHVKQYWGSRRRPPRPPARPRPRLYQICSHLDARQSKARACGSLVATVGQLWRGAWKQRG